MWTLLLYYSPLALLFTALFWLMAQRLSRRGTGAFPRRPGALQQALARALEAAPVIDDAGIGWRRIEADGGEWRLTLPFAWNDEAVLTAAEGAGRLAVPRTPVDDWSRTLDDRTADLSRDGTTRFAPRHFAFVLRQNLAELRPAHGALPVAYGLPVELLSDLYSTETGRPPAWQADGAPPAPAPAPDFELKTGSIAELIADWPTFDRDLSALFQAATDVDFRRAWLLTRDRVIWLEQPIWPAQSAPPAPFLINMLEDEIQVLVVFPGHSPAAAFADIAWLADSIHWYTAALPHLTAGARAAQRLARQPVPDAAETPY